jgi:uncharacterized protein (TIGR03118 family)
MTRLRPVLAATAATCALLAASPSRAVQFVVTNLVSNGPIPAANHDPAMVNPWGLASSPTGPFWTSDNGTGVSTIYNGAGVKQPLTVTIPGPGGAASTPTGVVFNGTASAFAINGAKPLFIFDTQDGTLAGWAPAFGTTAMLAPTATPGAIYTGLALGEGAGGASLFAADFHSGGVNVFDSNYNLTGALKDPTLAPGYAPFNVQVLNGELFVAYAKQDEDQEDEVAGAGLGYVDVFNLDGSFNRRIASAGSALNAPWGLAIAPNSFGSLAGSLLVGNFGDGTISAFDPLSGAFRGVLRGTDGKPLVIDGLWALRLGNGGAGGGPQKVYFTAGPEDETQGLFGSLTAVPEPRTWTIMILGLGLMGGALRTRRARAA